MIDEITCQLCDGEAAVLTRHGSFCKSCGDEALDWREDGLYPAFKGRPKLEVLERHKQNHPRGNWIVCDPRYRDFMICVNLRVKHGQAEIQNGMTFWQPLDKCRWAERSFYRPLDDFGYDVPWPEVRVGDSDVLVTRGDSDEAAE